MSRLIALFLFVATLAKAHPIIHMHPPKYLTLTGWQACVGEKKTPTSTHLCLQYQKPEQCQLKTWNLLLLDQLPAC
jgi:hypothetical protein